MPTRKGLIEAWGIITTTTGTALPWSGATVEPAISAWLLVLGDVTDERLLELVVAWLRTSEAKFGKWPVPGALLHAFGDEAVVDAADEAWADALWIAERAKRIGGGALERHGWFRAFQLCDELHATGLVAAVNQRWPQRGRRTSTCRDMPPDNPQELASCGGWTGLVAAVKDADPETLGAHRASFRNAYRSAKARAKLTEGERAVAQLLDHADRPRRIGGT